MIKKISLKNLILAKTYEVKKMKLRMRLENEKRPDLSFFDIRKNAARNRWFVRTGFLGLFR